MCTDLSEKCIGKERESGIDTGYILRLEVILALTFQISASSTSRSILNSFLTILMEALGPCRPDFVVSCIPLN